MSLESAETATAPPVGIIFVAEDADPSLRVAGLAVGVRQALGFASAGIDRIWVAGPGAGVERLLTELRSDPRLAKVECSAREELLEGAAFALVIGCEATVHRAWFTWAAQLPPPQAIERHGEGLLRVPGEALVGFSDALASGARDALAGETQVELPSGLFVHALRDAPSRRAALRAHLRSLVKPTGGVIDRRVMRPVSLQLTRVLMNTPVSPNAISVATLILALISAVLAASTQPVVYVAGGLLHFAVRILDCVDGELARLRHQASAFGQWLDTVGDGVGVAALVAAVTYKTAPAGPQWLGVGVVGVVAYTMVQVLQLQIARRETGGGSLQAVAWAFQRPDARGVDRFVGAIHNFVRIDFISTLYAVLVIADQGRVLLVLHLLASFGGVAYLLGQRIKLGQAVDS